MSNKQDGTVKFFNQEKGYGFIKRETGDDLFFHVSDVANAEEGLDQGQKVTFEVGQSDRGEKAVSIAKED